MQALILPALFDEANRMRRFTVQLMHGLVRRGIGAVLPDLPGTGESETELARVGGYDWLRALHDCSLLLNRERTIVVALRGGASLLAGLERSGFTAPARCWQLSPEPGARLLRDLGRAQAVARRGDAAYPISDDLGGWLQQLEPRVEGARTVRLRRDPLPADDRIDGSPLWRRAEPGEDAAMVDAAAANIAHWLARCEA